LFGLLFEISLASAQYFQFSQYSLTEQRTNPATVASSDYARGTFLFRNQSTGTDVKLTSSYISAIYPFIKANEGKRWSGIGVSAMVDKSGIGGLYKVSELSVSYALNVFLSRYQTLSFGLTSKYHSGNFSFDALSTGSQYVIGQGLLENIPSGENFKRFTKNYFAFGTGIYWQGSDRDDRKVAHFGLSAFDINHPNENFLDKETKVLSTIVIEGGFQLYDKGLITVYPEFLWTNTSGTNNVSVGIVTTYDLRQYKRNTSVNILTKYNVGNVFVLGLQYQKDDFLLGVSYDVPIHSNVANHGAFEIGARYQRLVKSKNKSRKRRRNKKKKSKVVNKKTVVKQDKQKVEKKIIDIIESVEIVEEILEGEEMIKKEGEGNTDYGDLKREPFLFEGRALVFEFDFNKAFPSKASEEYLSEIVNSMKEDKFIKIRIIGHTDNVGGAAYNLMLSKKRAKAIQAILMKGGISRDRITLIGKGEEVPLSDNRTAENRNKNRRVELLFYY